MAGRRSCMRNPDFRKACVTLAAAPMFLLGSAALAADEGQEATEGGWYLGAGAGRTRLTRGVSGTSDNVSAERSSAAKVFLGYQFKRPLAFEVTHAWCGTVRGFNLSPAVPTETFEIRALTFQLVGTLLRADNVALQARIGSLAWRAFPRPSPFEKVEGLGYAGGVNLKFDIEKNVAVRADFDAYRRLLESGKVTWGANVVSLNIIGSFK